MATAVILPPSLPCWFSGASVLKVSRILWYTSRLFTEKEINPVVRERQSQGRVKSGKFLKGTATNSSAAMLAKSRGPFAITLGLWKKNKPDREEERKSFFLQHSWKSHCSTEFFSPFYVHSFGMDFAPLLASLRRFIVRCIYGLWNQIYKAESCSVVLQF